MQNAAFRSKKLHWVYLAFRVTPETLPAALAGLQSLDVVGLNITIPLKVLAVRHLGHLDKSAEECGAVNAVARRNSEWVGYNTDVDGVLYAFNKHQAKVSGCKALILGAGGAARAVIFALHKLGCRQVTLANRTRQRAQQLAHEFHRKLGITTSHVLLTPASISEAASRADIISNTTPLGSTGVQAPGLVSVDALASNHIVFDVVYSPMKTQLLRDAESKHARVIPGYDMLVGQGAYSFRLWTHLDLPFDVMERAVLKELKR